MLLEFEHVLFDTANHESNLLEQIDGVSLAGIHHQANKFESWLLFDKLENMTQ